MILTQLQRSISDFRQCKILSVNSNRQKEILKLLEDQDLLSLKEIMEKLNDMNLSPRTIRLDLSTLKKKKIISSNGFGRGSKWFILEEKIRHRIRQ